MHPQDSPVRIPLHARDGSIRAYALVDQADGHLAQLRWRLGGNGYAMRNLPRAEKRRVILLHREVMGLVPGDGIEGDHINRDKLDNRRANLRPTTRAQNAQNRPKAPGTSAYRGVTWVPRCQKWQAQGYVNGRTHWLGYHTSEADAGRAVAEFRAQNLPFATP